MPTKKTIIATTISRYHIPHAGREDEYVLGSPCLRGGGCRHKAAQRSCLLRAIKRCSFFDSHVLNDLSTITFLDHRLSPRSHFKVPWKPSIKPKIFHMPAGGQFGSFHIAHQSLILLDSHSFAQYGRYLARTTNYPWESIVGTIGHDGPCLDSRQYRFAALRVTPLHNNQFRLGTFGGAHVVV